MQLHGGPLDGAYCGDCDLQKGVLQRGIASRICSSGAQVWGYYDGPNPAVRVVYRIAADGKLRHLHSERLEAL